MQTRNIAKGLIAKPARVPIEKKEDRTTRQIQSRSEGDNTWVDT